MKRLGAELVATTAAAARQWMTDGGPRLAAALAYYALLSLAPLVVVATGIAGAVIGRDVASRELTAQFEALFGAAGAGVAEQFLAAPVEAPGRRLAAWLGSVLLVVSASAVFAELQSAMNLIWRVRPRARAGWRARLRRRFLSFAMVLGTGFLLLVSLVASAALAAAGRFLRGLAPGQELLWSVIDSLLGFALPIVLFALILRLVPDAVVSWRAAWAGALVGALLFAFARVGIAYYLGRRALDSAYGAAAALVGVVIWVYFSAQILFLSAELARVIDLRRSGHRAPAREGARPELDAGSSGD
jgi:membrane protein